MGNLKVGYDALDAAAYDINQAALDIEERLAGLERRMEGRRAEWTGAASDAFTEARLHWNAAMTDMRSVLRDIGVTVQMANEEYQRSEAVNAGRFAGR